MKVTVYDPLFSNVGHFFRYNKHVLSLLSDNPSITEIEYISSGDEGVSYKSISPKINVVDGVSILSSSQIASYQTKGLKKVKLYLKMIINYMRIIRYINGSSCDFCFFTSNGMFPFWLASSLTIKVKFVVSVISLKWFYDKLSSKFLLYLAYNKFLRKASLIFVTEEFYKEVLDRGHFNHVAVLNDRWLKEYKRGNECTKNNFDKPLRLVTLGTISHMKNPISFVRVLQSAKNVKGDDYSYEIYGKSLDDSGKELAAITRDNKAIKFFDDYLESEEFDSLMVKADFVVIPYDGDYTKFMTSGVMWDCFKYKKPILCPDLEPFRFYIDTYKIGYIYTPETLLGLISQIASLKTTIIEDIQKNYDILYDEISHEKLLKKFVYDLDLVWRKE